MAIKSQVQKTVEAMRNQIGELRNQCITIDQMPVKLQQIRFLLQELEAELVEPEALRPPRVKVQGIEAARLQALRFSSRYSTYWYVRKVADSYEPWAHHSDDERTIAAFYCGKPVQV